VGIKFLTYSHEVQRIGDLDNFTGSGGAYHNRHSVKIVVGNVVMLH
jgi:hypothetical protein